MHQLWTVIQTLIGGCKIATTPSGYSSSKEPKRAAQWYKQVATCAFWVCCGVLTGPSKLVAHLSRTIYDGCLSRDLMERGYTDLWRLTKGSSLVSKSSRLDCTFFAIALTRSGSNFAASSSLIAVRAMLRPSPIAGGDLAPPATD